MIGVRLLGIHRPQLAGALALRGLAVGPAGVTLAAEGAAPFDADTVLEARDPASAAGLLDAGAGDVVLASDPDTLVAARLDALARRRTVDVLVVGDVRIDLYERRVTRGGRAVALLPREYAVLLHLARSAGDTVSRQSLRDGVWGRGLDPGTNVIEVHVSRLRAKLHRGFDVPVLLTDKGRGYRLSAGAGVAGERPGV